ncbi:MAG: NUDIX hydrolase [Candidatus Dadabacteria bacterium]|nr:MAG: NUDIX hydrolase [Candidatus Dadabacteria bacterium]
MKSYTKLTSKKVFGGKIFDLFRDSVLLPDGRRSERDIVKHPGAVVILAVDGDGQIKAIRQYRYAVGSEIIELPAGTLENGEEPEACARRELKEEIGFAAKVWHHLGEIYPAPGFCTERQQAYFATDLIEEKESGDADEIIEPASFSAEEFELAISQNKIKDAKSIAVYFLAKLKGVI